MILHVTPTGGSKIADENGNIVAIAENWVMAAAFVALWNATVAVQKINLSRS